jgi:hypothetical protein
MRANSFNINHLDLEGIKKLFELDDSFIGTKNYLGHSYFWDWEYRHYLRSATYSKRRQVHRHLLKANLTVSETSPKHLAIIKKITKIY